MKRCPECRRDYYDDTLLYCLDDGNLLLEGPASADEPATAILHSTADPGEASTREQINTTDETAILPRGTEAEPQENLSDSTEKQNFSARRMAKPLATLTVTILILVVGFFGNRYFSPAKQINSIAVLPFQNASGNADSEYLSDGLAESLIYRLSQIPDLKVSPRSSVYRYKGQQVDAEKIGAELGVDAVMSGRMVQRGDNLTISVDLVDVRNKKTLWGEQYERKMSDLLTTQREIAATITEKLQLKLSGNSPKNSEKHYTDSNEAYQAYLKGRFFWNRRDSENLRKSIEHFKSAAEIDPNFALAYVGLADSYGVAGYYDSALGGTDTLAKAKSYAARALEIDDSLAEAHASLANINTGLWNWDEAEKGYKRAIELNPNYASAHQWYGNHLFNFMRYDEAMAETTRAQELEPLSLIINLNLAELYLMKGDVPTSIDKTQRTIDLDPNWYYPHVDMAYLRLMQGQNADAVAEAVKGVEMSHRDSFMLGMLGFIYARTGKRAEAEAILAELKTNYGQRKANGLDIARVYVGLGDKDQAFAWLEKDFQARISVLPTWLATPPLDSLQDDPRFKDLERRIGIFR